MLAPVFASEIANITAEAALLSWDPPALAGLVTATVALSIAVLNASKGPTEKEICRVIAQVTEAKAEEHCIEQCECEKKWFPNRWLCKFQCKILDMILNIPGVCGGSNPPPHAQPAW